MFASLSISTLISSCTVSGSCSKWVLTLTQRTSRFGSLLFIDQISCRILLFLLPCICCVARQCCSYSHVPKSMENLLHPDFMVPQDNQCMILSTTNSHVRMLLSLHYVDKFYTAVQSTSAAPHCIFSIVILPNATTNFQPANL